VSKDTRAAIKRTEKMVKVFAHDFGNSLYYIEKEIHTKLTPSVNELSEVGVACFNNVDSNVTIANNTINKINDAAQSVSKQIVEIKETIQGNAYIGTLKDITIIATSIYVLYKKINTNSIIREGLNRKTANDIGMMIAATVGLATTGMYDYLPSFSNAFKLFTSAQNLVSKLWSDYDSDDDYKQIEGPINYNEHACEAVRETQKLIDIHKEHIHNYLNLLKEYEHKNANKLFNDEQKYSKPTFSTGKCSITDTHYLCDNIDCGCSCFVCKAMADYPPEHLTSKHVSLCDCYLCHQGDHFDIPTSFITYLDNLGCTPQISDAYFKNLSKDLHKQLDIYDDSYMAKINLLTRDPKTRLFLGLVTLALLGIGTSLIYKKIKNTTLKNVDTKTVLEGEKDAVIIAIGCTDENCNDNQCKHPRYMESQSENAMGNIDSKPICKNQCTEWSMWRTTCFHDLTCLENQRCIHHPTCNKIRFPPKKLLCKNICDGKICEHSIYCSVKNDCVHHQNCIRKLRKEGYDDEYNADLYLGKDQRGKKGKTKGKVRRGDTSVIGSATRDKDVLDRPYIVYDSTAALKNLMNGIGHQMNIKMKDGTNRIYNVTDYNHYKHLRDLLGPEAKNVWFSDNRATQQAEDLRNYNPSGGHPDVEQVSRDTYSRSEANWDTQSRENRLKRGKIWPELKQEGATIATKPQDICHNTMQGKFCIDSIDRYDFKTKRKIVATCFKEHPNYNFQCKNRICYIHPSDMKNHERVIHNKCNFQHADVRMHHASYQELDKNNITKGTGDFSREIRREGLLQSKGLINSGKDKAIENAARIIDANGAFVANAIVYKDYVEFMAHTTESFTSPFQISTTKGLFSIPSDWQNHKYAQYPDLIGTRLIPLEKDGTFILPDFPPLQCTSKELSLNEDIYLVTFKANQTDKIPNMTRGQFKKYVNDTDESKCKFGYGDYDSLPQTCGSAVYVNRNGNLFFVGIHTVSDESNKLNGFVYATPDYKMWHNLTPKN